jgi:hypothetical protein
MEEVINLTKQRKKLVELSVGFWFVLQNVGGAIIAFITTKILGWWWDKKVDKDKKNR